MLRPNKRLKLTELAVDEFAARQFAEALLNNRYVRAIEYIAGTFRRRSLAAIR